jgi:hypothetical protein
MHHSINATSAFVQSWTLSTSSLLSASAAVSGKCAIATNPIVGIYAIGKKLNEQPPVYEKFTLLKVQLDLTFARVNGT